MDCARHHLRGRRHGNVAENVFYYLPHLPRAAVRVPSPPPPLCSVLPSFQVLGKNKMGSSRAEEEEEDENMTKMGGNKMDRLRTSSSPSSSSRAAVAATAAVAQFFSADERSWMVL